MKIGLGLYRESLTPDNFQFATQAGATHIVAHMTNYFRGKDPAISRGDDADGWGDCSQDRLWGYEELAALVANVRGAGLELAAIENFSPRFWSDILLDGPERAAQIQAMKRLIRDAGRAGVPCFGYNFSIAGVWGWRRGPFARGGAHSVAFDASQIDPDLPLHDGMVWNMRYRPARAGAAPVTVTSAELWDRLTHFLTEMVPVAEEAGVTLAAHPDDPPMEALRGAARLVNRPEKYDRLLDIFDSPANAVELCLGSLQEMPGWPLPWGICGGWCRTRRHWARHGRGPRAAPQRGRGDAGQLSGSCGRPLWAAEEWAVYRKNNVHADGEMGEVAKGQRVLYRMDPAGVVTAWRRGLGISNTLSWSPDGQRFNSGDTLGNEICACDYANGQVSGDRVHFAGFDRRMPDGSVDRVVKMAVHNVTTCVFGRADLKTQFITTASPGALSGNRLAGWRPPCRACPKPVSPVISLSCSVVRWGPNQTGDPKDEHLSESRHLGRWPVCSHCCQRTGHHPLCRYRHRRDGGAAG